MRDRYFFSKCLVVWIIVLFVGVSVLSCVSSKSLSISDENLREDDIESIDNSESGVADDYKEIITLITGNGDIIWIKRRGLFRGEVQIVGEGPPIPTIQLHGYRFSNGGVEYYSSSVFDVHVYFFRGFSIGEFVFGIAMGNIE